MKVPDGYSEKEVCEIIKGIVGALSRSFRFGYYELEDIRQQAWIFGIEALEKFNPSFEYKLDSFLYGHIRRRLMDFKRDNFYRAESPCKSCPFFDPENLKSINQCAEFQDKTDCPKWSAWKSRNLSKRNVVMPEDIDEINDELEHSMKSFTESENIVSKEELLSIIDDKLDVKYRADYRRMLDGVKIAKSKRDKLIKILKEILVENKDE